MTGMPDKGGQRWTMAPAPPLDDGERSGSVQSDLLRTAAALAQDGVGGDVDGLRALATTLYGCVPAAASIIDGLAAELARSEHALEEKAYVASRYGVKIGTDGRPPPASAGPAADVMAASEQHWALAYRQVYEQAMEQVRQARQRAARQLTDLYAQIEPSREPGSGTGTAMVTGRELLPTS